MMNTLRISPYLTFFTKVGAYLRSAMTSQQSGVSRTWSFFPFGEEDEDGRPPRPRPSLLQSRTWTIDVHRAVNMRQRMASIPTNAGSPHTSISIAPIRPEPDDPDTAHGKRRHALIAKLASLASSCQDLYSEIHETSQYIDTPAFQETRSFWISIMIIYARATLEAINLRISAEYLEIHRLSSFWVRAWQAVHEQYESIRMTREAIKDMNMDYEHRKKVVAWSQDLIDGFQIQFFQAKIQRLLEPCSHSAERIRSVNRFASREHKRPVRVTQWVDGEDERLPETVERMAMRRLVPPSLQEEIQ